MRPLISCLVLGLLLLLGAVSVAVKPPPALTYSATTDTLSGRIAGIPLTTVLDDLSHQSGIAVFIHPASADTEISAEFTDLPLHDGIKQLLSEHSYVLIYDQRRAPDNHDPQRAILHVLKQDFPASIQRTDTTLGAVTHDIQALLQTLWNATDLEARHSALQAIAEHDLSSLLGAITTTAQETDLRTREAVLHHLQTQVPETPLSLLSEIAVTDPDPTVRLHALALLAELGQEAFAKLTRTPTTDQTSALTLLSETHRATLATTAATALNDSHAEVRGMALDTLHQQAEHFPPPVAEVTAIALHDPQPELRLRALELIASTSPDAKALLNQALHDSDPRVREQVQDLLTEFTTDH